MTHRRPRYPLTTLLVLAVIIPVDAFAQARSTSEVTLTGTWEIAVDTRGRRGRPELLTLSHNSDGTLIGAFIVQSLRSEEPITEGRVDLHSFSFHRSSIQAVYEGTIDGDQISGTMKQPSGNQVLSYTFSGVRTSVEIISFAPPPGSESPQAPASAEAPAPTETRPDPTPPQPRRVIDSSRVPSPTQANASPQAAERPTECMLNCVGEGEVTIDGQAVSFTLDQCTVLGRGGGTWSGKGEGEGGPFSFSVAVHQSPLRHTAQITMPEANYRAEYAAEENSWTRETRDERRIFRVAAPGPLITHGATDVTASGIFNHRDDYTEHVTELRVTCQPR